jgi:hypothetical protein
MVHDKVASSFTKEQTASRRRESARPRLNRPNRSEATWDDDNVGRVQRLCAQAISLKKTAFALRNRTRITFAPKICHCVDRSDTIFRDRKIDPR